MAAAADSHRVHRTDIQLRFADTDALGHLNNVSFAVYAEVARIELVHGLGEQASSIILAHLSLDFRRQVHLGSEVYVRTWVERVGNTSMTLLQEVLADGEVAAEVRSVVVSFDYEMQRPKPWSANWREAIAPYVQYGAVPHE